jgi:hypothetical protein
MGGLDESPIRPGRILTGAEKLSFEHKPRQSGSETSFRIADMHISKGSPVTTPASASSSRSSRSAGPKGPVIRRSFAHPEFRRFYRKSGVLTGLPTAADEGAHGRLGPVI